MSNLQEILDEVQADCCSAKKAGYKVVVTVALTANNEKVYATPIRFANEIFITGFVVCATPQGIEIVRSLTAVVDVFFC